VPDLGHNGPMVGRFAPSPTGELHLGNLRTAAIAWLAARSRGAGFLVRMEDLDRHQSSPEHERSQLADLSAIGIDWDGDVVRQSDRFDRYGAAIDRLVHLDLVYECFCTRREIREEIEASPHAPHGPPGSYPGTCRGLGDADRERRRAEGRRPALRLRSDHRVVRFTDRLHGDVEGVVDDVVLRRNDGVPAYNLAVVIDDAAQGVTEVVRGDDLLSSTPRQIHLQELLDLPRPDYLHVPLVVDADGERLAKRRGVSVTIADLADRGVGVEHVVAWVVESLGLGPAASLEDLVGRFDVARLGTDAVAAPAVTRGDTTREHR
jgi:glutamyl-tRNA synthetase